MGATTEREPLEWDVGARCAPGETDSGDLHVLCSFPGGALAGVVDGLGHGADAARAARTAVEVLEKHAGASPIRLIELCHGVLRTTRGAVMTLASFNHRESTFTAIGVGNVEAVLLRADRRAEPRSEHVLLRSGIVGERLPNLQASIFAIAPGDVLILASDGVRHGFDEEVNVTWPAERIVRHILGRNLRGDDDALVLALRYPGKACGA